MSVKLMGAHRLRRLEGFTAEAALVWARYLDRRRTCNQHLSSHIGRLREALHEATAIQSELDNRMSHDLINAPRVRKQFLTSSQTALRHFRGGNFLLKTFFSLKRLSIRRQTILRPSLVLIFQGEADGDGFGSKFLLKTHFFSETAFRSTPDDFKTIFGTDFSRRSRW